MARNITSLLFLLAAVGLFWFWTKPVLNTIDVLVAEKTTFDEALSNSRELQQLRDDLLVKYNSITASDLEKLSKMVPPEPRITELMVEMSDVSRNVDVTVARLDARESTVSMGIVSLPSSDKLSDYQKVDLNIDVVASYENFITFLNEIERSLRIIDVDRISFFSNADNFYTFNISAVSYFRR